MKPAALPSPEPEVPPLSFRVIWDLGRTYLGRRVALLACYVVGTLLCQAVLGPRVAVLLGKLTNAAGYQAGNTSILFHAYVGWVGLTILLVSIGFALRYLTTTLDVSVGNALRGDVFANVLRQGPQFFHERDAGQLTTIVNQLSIEAQIGLRQLLVDPVLQIITVGATGIAIYGQLAQELQGGRGNDFLAFFGFVAVAALASPWLVSRMANRLQRAQMALQRQTLGLSSLVNGAVGAPEEIQAMRAEALFDQKHQGLLASSLAARRRSTLTLEMVNLLNRLPGDLVLFALLGVAIYLATQKSGGLQPGTLVAVAGLTPQFMGAIQSLSSFSISVSMGWPAIFLVNDVLSSRGAGTGSPPPPAVDPLVPAAAAPVRGAPALNVHHLTFSYWPGTLPNVLDDMSFVAPPGQITGLVARAGQGKTTLFRLALRFYDPQGGDIRLDGAPHTSLELSELRRRIVMMAQFPAFFHDTVRQNLLLARPDASDSELRRLCEFTGIWSVLEAHLAEGGDPLDAPFRAGTPLSGGQKKLFALTRCLLRDPDYLFLDEPTTGMDPDTKFDFIAPMRASCAGKTVVVVDHDILWQLRFCDSFIVLDGGKIVEQGTGRELLARHGVFRELFDKQTEGLIQLLRLLEELDLPVPAGSALAPTIVA